MQKTAYEMRISDWSSDVCSSDLKYLSNKPCPECDGQRLNRASRHVFVADRNLPSITELSVRDAEAFFGKMKLPGHKQKIADKIIKEIGARLGFLNNVGLDYLTLARSAETLSGVEEIGRAHV